MLLETLIQPRRDGTLSLTGKSGTVYPFSPSGEGAMIGEVGEDDALELLNRSDDFFPSRDEDVARLIELRRAAMPLEQAAGGGDDPEGDDPVQGGGDDLDDDDPVDPSALPIEANTPPAAAAKAQKPATSAKAQKPAAAAKAQKPAAAAKA